MFTVTEPHPTVQANAYTHSGRGGAGNTFRAPVTTPAAGVPTPALYKIPSAGSSANSSGRFYAGRGGAGNAHAIAERREPSLEDEYAYAAAAAQVKPVGHVGRGGAGNVFKKSSSSSSSQIPQHRKASNASSSSSSSTSSLRSGFWGKLHHH